MNRFRRDEKREGIVKTYRGRRDAEAAGLPRSAKRAKRNPMRGRHRKGRPLLIWGNSPQAMTRNSNCWSTAIASKSSAPKLVDAYNLEGLPDHVIVSIAQKHMAADQRLARVKEREAANPPHGSEPEHSEAPAPGAPEPTNPSARAYAPEADGLDPGLSPGRAKPALITGKAQRDR